MKIDYDSNTKSKRDWELGDVIQDIDGDFYLVSEVTSEDDIFLYFD